MPSISGGTALLSAAGTIGGSLIGANSAQKASDAQVQAAQLAIAEQQREYDQTRTDHMPWLTTGGSALDKLAGIYGLDTYQNGQLVKGSGQTSFGSFWQSPDYKFARSEGLKGVDAGAAAGGSLDSGATRKAEIGYAGNLASSQFNTYANRLAGIAGVGQTAADSIGSAGMNAANQISNQYGNIGNAQASSYLSQGQQYGNAISGLAGMFSGAGSNGMFSSGGSGDSWLNGTSQTGQSGGWGGW